MIRRCLVSAFVLAAPSIAWGASEPAPSPPAATTAAPAATTSETTSPTPAAPATAAPATAAPATAAPASGAPATAPAATAPNATDGAAAHTSTADAETELIPPAKDTLSGHLVISAGPAVAVPFAEIDRRLDFPDRAGPGFGVSGNLGVGLSRTVVLGAWGDYLSFGEANDDCPDCEATSLGFGAFVRYHLVQGVRFDPWMAIGAGYRMLDTKVGSESVSYSGIEWLRLEVGGDWYALSQVGFGPFAELNLGSFTDLPSGRDVSVYGTALFGVRLTLDVPGK